MTKLLAKRDGYAPMPKTGAERQRAYHRKMLKCGMVRVMLYVPNDEKDRIKGIARGMLENKELGDYAKGYNQGLEDYKKEIAKKRKVKTQLESASSSF